MADVLVVDDDQMMCDVLSIAVERLGHQADRAHTLNQGLNKAMAGDFDVVFLDVGMPDGDGLSILPAIRNVSSRPEVIIITGRGDPDGAELAIKQGAWDYVEKGSSMQDMILPLSRAIEYRGHKQKSSRPVALKMDGIIGRSFAMKQCFNLLAQDAASDANVLICGESGTGKEVFAQAVHDNSSRAEGSFVVVDCAAIPGTLVENILFGHHKGAFTGADREREGLMGQADGGSLFLDEVGELPLEVQKKFLRALEQRSYRPLGGSREISSDFRLIAATNKDLEEMVEQGRFRRDLLFRLKSLHIKLPPLRERMEDLSLLVIHFVHSFCRRQNMDVKGFSPEFLEALSRHEWPGNVRELINIVELSVLAASDSPTLYPRHLPESLRVAAARLNLDREPDSLSAQGETAFPSPLPSLKEVVKQETARVEAAYLRKLLDYVQGDIQRACFISNLSRSSLYARLKKYGLTQKK